MSPGNNDNYYMSHAIKLARKGLYTTHPNPRVGCVVVKDGSIVGEAWHDRAGQPHAEVLALRQSGRPPVAPVFMSIWNRVAIRDARRRAPAFLIDAGVTRVVAAMEDPNPQVAGGGIQNLRSAGIEVDVGVMRKEAERLNRGFLHRINKGRPWVTLKVAASMDGRTAMHSGESRVDLRRGRAQGCSPLACAKQCCTDRQRYNTGGRPRSDRAPCRYAQTASESDCRQ